MTNFILKYNLIFSNLTWKWFRAWIRFNYEKWIHKFRQKDQQFFNNLTQIKITISIFEATNVIEVIVVRYSFDEYVGSLILFNFHNWFYHIKILIFNLKLIWIFLCCGIFVGIQNLSQMIRFSSCNTITRRH